MSGPARVVPPVEIDAYHAAAFDDALGRCDAEGETVVDLGDVTLVDSAGIRVLVVHGLRHLHAGGTLRVEHPRPAVRRVLAIVGVSRLLGLEQDEF
jgi:stage II sporulation protein AA (anti-sigma F factor antagonist)